MVLEAQITCPKLKDCLYCLQSRILGGNFIEFEKPSQTSDILFINSFPTRQYLQAKVWPPGIEAFKKVLGLTFDYHPIIKSPCATTAEPSLKQIEECYQFLEDFINENFYKVIISSGQNYLTKRNKLKEGVLTPIKYKSKEVMTITFKSPSYMYFRYDGKIKDHVVANQYFLQHVKTIWEFLNESSS